MLSVDAISAQLSVIKAKEAVSIQACFSGSRDINSSLSLPTPSLSPQIASPQVVVIEQQRTECGLLESELQAEIMAWVWRS